VPTGKRTDNDQMIYDFKAARRLAEAEPMTDQPAAQPAPQPAQQPQPAPGKSAADQDFDALPSASEGRDVPPIVPKGPTGPRVSRGAVNADHAPAVGQPAKLAAGPVFGTFRTWAKEFAGRYPRYRVGQTTEADLYHILQSAAAIAKVDVINEDNFHAVTAALETHAKTGQETPI
jgi:hypothetical protein